MARACVRGAQLMYEYLEQHRLPVERVGKLIVAADAREHEQVQLLFERGTKNGVQGLRILNGDEVRALEPNVSAAHSALWSPNTGVTDYAVVSRAIAAELEASGRGAVKLEFEVAGVARAEDGRVLVACPATRRRRAGLSVQHVSRCCCRLFVGGAGGRALSERAHDAAGCAPAAAAPWPTALTARLAPHPHTHDVPMTSTITTRAWTVGDCDPASCFLCCGGFYGPNDDSCKACSPGRFVAGSLLNKACSLSGRAAF